MSHPSEPSIVVRLLAEVVSRLDDGPARGKASVPDLDMPRPSPSPPSPLADPLPSDDTCYLTPEHVAEMLGSNRITVMKLMDTGRLRYADIGTCQRRFRRTTRAWVREFVARGQE